MTVCLEIKNTDIYWRYGNACWSELRKSIIKSFMIFLENWISLQSFIEGETFEWSFCENLKKLINDFKIFHQIDNISEVNLHDISLNVNLALLEGHIDNLSCFGFVGIYTLINKASGGAYYSCGNSYDIYNLLETIDRYIDKDQDIYDHIMEAKNVFERSYSLVEQICIS
jgi:hypothetical protein